MQFMLRYIAIALLGIILAACSAKPDAVDSQGKPIYVKDYHGKWLVINYWAEWCKPCITELPELNALYKQQVPQVMVIGVSFDGLADAEMQRVAQKLHIDFPMTNNFPVQKFGVEHVEALPITFLISPQGKLVKTLHGPQTQQSLLKEMQFPQ
jgi:peroxiredoxin